VTQVLTGPFAVAAIVVVVAGAAKLRAPAVAVAASREVGVRVRPGVVRAFSAAEVALGVWCLVAPAGAAAGALACCYAAFAVISLLLVRRRASCGCFGEGEAPASIAQPLISGVLAMVCVLATVGAPHGIGWMLARPAGHAAVLLLGIAGLAYATVLAYTQLPAAWGAWSTR
jgi:hypothetical protein